MSSERLRIAHQHSVGDTCLLIEIRTNHGKGRNASPDNRRSRKEAQNKATLKSLLALHGVWCRVETMEKRGDIRPQALAWLTPPFRWKPVRCPITNQRPFVLCCNRFSLRTKPTHSQVQVSKRSGYHLRCLICKMCQRVYWSIGGGGGVECHTPLAPAELRVAPSRLTLSRPRHTGKDPPLIKVTTDRHIIHGHI